MIACAIAGVLIILTTGAIYLTVRRAGVYDARHAFTDPAEATDPDGTWFIAELHHELPAAGILPMVHVPPPADTAPLPHAVGTWGKSITELLDEMEAAYRQVTQ